MSKQGVVQAKSASADLTRSALSVLQLGSTLGPHAGIQRPASPQPSLPATALVREVVNSPGRPLDALTRARMESRFGCSLDRVRLHTDDRAASSARAVDADAYTLGNHVVFGAGKHSPGTSAGQSMIAHELTHVVQQATGPVAGMPLAEGLSVSHPADPFEQAADRVARGVMPASAAARPSSGSTGAREATIQRIMEQPKQTTGPQPTTAPVTAPPASQPNTPNALNLSPLPYATWEKIEARFVPELGIDFLEIGRIAAVDVKQQLYDFFVPYDDSIVDANQKFGSYVNVALAAAGNFPQDPGPSSGPSPPYSWSSGLAGGVAQVGQVVVGNILDTNTVGKAKQRAQLDVEYLVADTLTTDSPIYEGFEQGALQEVRAGAEAEWKELQQVFPPELLPSPSPTRWVRYVRTEFGPHSKRVKTVIGGLKGKVDGYLAKLKTRLDNLQANARRQREKAGVIGGAIAGSLIGGAIGLGAGGGVGGVLAGLFGGAVVGGFLGGVGSTIFEATKGKPEENLRSPEERAKDREEGRSLGKGEAEEEEKKEP